MKTSSAIIRWKFVLPTAIFIGALIAFFVLFFDPLLARVIETVGGRVNGAKVEVTNLKTKIFQGRITIRRLQVANKENVMKNIVEGGPLVFQVLPGDLLKKRVVIPEAGLEGLKFNTPRKTSGKLLRAPKDPDGKPGVASRLASKYAERFTVNFEGMKDQAKQKVEFDPKDLAVTKQADALKAKSESAPAEWEKRINTLDFEGRLKKVEQDLKEIENTPTKGAESLPAIAASLKKLNQVKTDLNHIKTDAENTKQAFNAEVQSLKAGVSGLSEAKRKDMDNILSRFNLDFADPRKLVEGMLGPVLLTRMKTGMRYVEMARAHMPSKKERESLPPKPRFKGVDIKFPTPAAPPRFWLKKATLGGEYEGLVAKGVLTHATSDPSRIGQPFKIDLSGQQAGRLYAANAVLDHTGDVKKDSLALSAKNVSMKEVITEGLLADALMSGMGDLEFGLRMMGESEIGGHIKLDMRGMKLDRALLLKHMGLDSDQNLNKGDALKATFVKNLAGAMESMPVISVGGQLTGTFADPGFAITSNLTDVVGGVIKSSIGGAVAEQRKELEARLDQITNARKAELNEKIGGLQNQVNAKISGVTQQIEDKIKKASGIDLKGESPIPGIKVPKLDKIFGK